MALKNFLVTGATGDTGGYTVEQLLERGHAVRALAHREDDRSKRLEKMGAEVVIGDFLKFNDVRAAMRGVRGAYFCYPIRPGILQATAYFAQAAKEAGLECVVNMSQKSAREDCAEPRGAGSLALRAGLRLVGNYGDPPSPHVFCRMAAVPGSHDPHWTAACPVWHRSPCSHRCRGSGPSDRGDSGKSDCPSPARLSALWPGRVHLCGDCASSQPRLKERRPIQAGEH